MLELPRLMLQIIMAIHINEEKTFRHMYKTQEKKHKIPKKDKALDS